MDDREVHYPDDRENRRNNDERRTEGNSRRQHDEGAGAGGKPAAPTRPGKPSGAGTHDRSLRGVFEHGRKNRAIDGPDSGTEAAARPPYLKGRPGDWLRLTTGAAERLAPVAWEV